MAEAYRASEVEGLIGSSRLAVEGKPVRGPQMPDEAEAAEDARREDMTPSDLAEAEHRDAIVLAANQGQVGDLGVNIGDKPSEEGDRNLGAKLMPERADFDDQEATE